MFRARTDILEINQAKELANGAYKYVMAHVHSRVT